MSTIIFFFQLEKQMLGKNIKKVSSQAALLLLKRKNSKRNGMFVDNKISKIKGKNAQTNGHS